MCSLPVDHDIIPSLYGALHCGGPQEGGALDRCALMSVWGGDLTTGSRKRNFWEISAWAVTALRGKAVGWGQMGIWLVSSLGGKKKSPCKLKHESSCSTSWIHYIWLLFCPHLRDLFSFNADLMTGQIFCYQTACASLSESLSQQYYFYGKFWR